MAQTSDSRLTHYDTKVTPEHKAPDGVVRPVSRARESLPSSYQPSSHFSARQGQQVIPGFNYTATDARDEGICSSE